MITTTTTATPVPVATGMGTGDGSGTTPSSAAADPRAQDGLDLATIRAAVALLHGDVKDSVIEIHQTQVCPAPARHPFYKENDMEFDVKSFVVADSEGVFGPSTVFPVDKVVRIVFCPVSAIWMQAESDFGWSAIFGFADTENAVPFLRITRKGQGNDVEVVCECSYYHHTVFFPNQLGKQLVYRNQRIATYEINISFETADEASRFVKYLEEKNHLCPMPKFKWSSESESVDVQH